MVGGLPLSEVSKRGWREGVGDEQTSPLHGVQKCCREIFSETVRGSCHGKCREISGDILLLLFPQETKLESAQNFSRRISRHFSRDVLRLQMPNFISFFILQTFVLDKPPKRAKPVLQKCVPLLLRGHRKKGTDKRPESLA